MHAHTQQMSKLDVQGTKMLREPRDEHSFSLNITLGLLGFSEWSYVSVIILKIVYIGIVLLII